MLSENNKDMKDYRVEFAEYFRVNNRVAVAFSGGVDSTYLLYAAVEAGADVKAYYVKSAFQPQFEVEDAIRAVDYINEKFSPAESDTDNAECGGRVELQFINLDVLSDENVAANPDNRCYYCKKQIMGAIIQAAQDDGYNILLDGNNASDDATDRPGMAATAELGVRSPLRELGATKSVVRRLSAEAGLFTADKPAYACLATRIPAGQRITAEKLAVTESAEGYLFRLGFTDFRIRMRGDAALIQVKEEQREMLNRRFSEIEKELLRYYSSVTVDSEAR